MIAAAVPELLEESIKKGYLSLNKFGRLIGVSYPTALRMRDRGDVICILVGGVYRVYHDEVERYLTEGNLKPQGTAVASSTQQSFSSE